MEKEKKRSYRNASLTVFVATEPELKYSATGVPFTRFAVAINAREDGDDPTWVNVVAFHGLAEAIADQVKKGDLVHAVGKLSTHHYNGKSSLEFVIDEIYVKVRPRRSEGEAAAAPVEEEVEELPF